MAYTLLAEVQNYIRRYNKIHPKLSIPGRSKVPKFLREVGEDISYITALWNPVEILTPDADNCKEEKDRFFNAFLEGRPYNPQFIYSYANTFDIKTNRKQLFFVWENLEQWRAKNRLEDLIKKSLNFKIQDDLATCDMVEGIQKADQHKIAAAIDHKYINLDSDLYNYSKREYKKKTERIYTTKNHKGMLSDDEVRFLKSITFYAEDIKKAFEWALREYRLLRTKDNESGYKVVIDEKATSIDVRDKSILGPTIFVPRTRKAKGDKLLGLIAHEIEGHVRQSMNGWELFMIGGGPMKIDDEMMYEGLAKRYDEEFRQKFFGYKEYIPHPYCTFAIQKVQKGFSFYEIFTEQLDMRLHVKLRIPPDQNIPSYSEIDTKLLHRCMHNAWNITIRVIRGHTDTENPRGFTMRKDLSYLRGWQIDKQLVELGHRHVNEAAIMTGADLSTLGEFDLRETHLPYPYKDITTKYWREVLRPQMIVPKTPLQSTYLPSSIPHFVYHKDE